MKNAKRVFSTMKLMKTGLRSKINDVFLADNLFVYIEKEITINFTIYIIMDEFRSIKNHRR
jgi:hypothetical protein